MTTVSAVIKEGKAKILEEGSQPGQLKVTFKDVATAFNGGKFSEIPGKGKLNATISAILFDLLNKQGLNTCFVEKADDTALIYNTLTMIPLEVVVRNVAYGSICKRYGLAEKTEFTPPLIEYFLKDDSLNDPAITPDVIEALDILPDEVSLDKLELKALQINEVFVQLFESIGICCADFKLEFGLDDNNNIVLGDELSPDNFRLRDMATEQVLDKDVFRLDLADLVETYTQLKARLDKAPDFKFTESKTYVATVTVQSRENILNPESKAILTSLNNIGYSNIEEVRAGKQFNLTLSATSLIDAEQQLKIIASDILSNPVIEDCDYMLMPVPDFTDEAEGQ